jgi:hypothetical protein
MRSSPDNRTSISTSDPSVHSFKSSSSSRLLPFLLGLGVALFMQWLSTFVGGWDFLGGSSVVLSAGGSPSTCGAESDIFEIPFPLQKFQADSARFILNQIPRTVCPIPRGKDGSGMGDASPPLSMDTLPWTSFVSCEMWPHRFAMGEGRSPKMDYRPTSFPGLHSLRDGLAGPACPFQSGDVPVEASWSRIISRLTLAASAVIDRRPAARRTYKVVALGGSEAAGVYCTNELVQGKECAWSARAVSWMRAVFPCADVSLFNYATGGTTITTGMASLHSWLKNPTDSDLLLVDFIVNDAFYDQVPANRPFGVVPASLSAAYEQFILQTRKARPDLDIIFVNTCALSRCIGLAAEIEKVAAYYGIPVISYAAVVAAASSTQELCGKDGSMSWWGPTGQTHPRWQVHQLMAETVQDCFIQRWGQFCGSGSNETSLPVPVSLSPIHQPAATLNTPSDLQKLAICDSPTTFYSASELIKQVSAGMPLLGITAHNWPLMEDRANKPGFIANSSDSEISFTVRFGAVPRLILTYLRSYEGLGAARMSFVGIPFPPDLGGRESGDRSIILDGLYARGSPELAAHVSQSFLLSLQVQHDAFQPGVGVGGLDGVLGFQIDPHSTHTLRFQADGGPPHKFKLLTITGC